MPRPRVRNVVNVLYRRAWDHFSHKGLSLSEGCCHSGSPSLCEERDLTSRLSTD